MDEKKTVNDAAVLESEWSDKKHYFGAPISFTYYNIANKRLYIKRGLLLTHYDEIMLYRIYDIKMVQSLWQRLFGVGTIIVYTTDASTSVNRLFRIINIKNPLSVRDLISRKVNSLREEMGIPSAEFIGSILS